MECLDTVSVKSIRLVDLDVFYCCGEVFRSDTKINKIFITDCEKALKIELELKTKYRNIVEVTQYYNGVYSADVLEI